MSIYKNVLMFIIIHNYMKNDQKQIKKTKFGQTNAITETK
jgi:hypothetical protein